MSLAANWRTVRSRYLGRPTYFRLTPQLYELWRAFRRYARGAVHGRILDAGAGWGAWRAELQAAGGTRPISADRAAAAGPDVVCDLGRLPFRAGVFDTVFCSQVIEHDPAPAALVASLAAALAPGGCLILTAPHASRLHDQPHDYFRFTRFGLAALVERAGLTLVGVYPCGGLLGLLKHYVNQTILAALARIPLANAAAVAGAALTTPGWAFADRVIDRRGVFAANHLLIARKDG